MRIQAAADFHGKRQRYEAFAAEAKQCLPDVAVLAGDVNGCSYFYAMLHELSVPTLVVHGNMDSVNIQEDIEACGAQFIHRKALCINDVRIVGIGGGEPENKTIFLPNTGQETALSEIEIDVLVTHIPPKGSMDKSSWGVHLGSTSVRNIVEMLKPRVVICGHVHEHPGWELLDGTVVVNCSIGQKGVCTLVDLNDTVKIERIK